MWKYVSITAMSILALLVLAASATASSGFAVGPPHIEVEIPSEGTASAFVYITSNVEGEIVIGTEDIPFSVEPGTVQVSSTDEYKEIELLFYGNSSVPAGKYSGKITFLLYSSNTVVYGVKIDADVTQIGQSGVVEQIIKSLQANYVLVIVSFMVVVALIVGVLIGRRTRKQRT